MSDEKEWMPRQSGNTTAFLPEYRSCHRLDKNEHWTEWKSVPTTDGHGIVGVPYPAFVGGLVKAIGLFGYEQAQALAWHCAADAASRCVKVETRVVTFEFQYELKARRLDERTSKLEEA